MRGDNTKIQISVIQTSSEERRMRLMKKRIKMATRDILKVACNIALAFWGIMLLVAAITPPEAECWYTIMGVLMVSMFLGGIAIGVKEQLCRKD